MNILIIFVVIALVLSPVYWLMPSPRQKRQIQVRQRAMSLGMQVKISDLPQTERARVRQEPVEQGVMYRLPWQHRNKSSGSFQQLLLRLELDEPSATAMTQYLVLKETLLQMPEQVIAIEYTPSGVAIYWHERGGVDVVEGLYQQLHKLQRQLTAGNIKAEVK